MYPKFFVAALLASAASLAAASPNPVPTPSPEEHELQARQNGTFVPLPVTEINHGMTDDGVAGDVLNSLTSVAGSAITGGGMSRNVLPQPPSTCAYTLLRCLNYLSGHFCRRRRWFRCY